MVASEDAAPFYAMRKFWPTTPPLARFSADHARMTQSRRPSLLHPRAARPSWLEEQKKAHVMKTIIILAQAAILSMVAVIGAYGDNDQKTTCPLPATAESAAHCEVEK